MQYFIEFKNYILFLIKKYKIPIIIATIHFYITTALQIDRLFFSYKSAGLKIMVVKFTYLILLVLAYSFTFNVYKKIKQKDKFYNRAFSIFIIYLVIILLILLAMWPGTWTWDDALTLNACKYYSYGAWQHFITGLMYDSILQIIPSPGIIVLFYNILISIIVAYIVTSFEINYYLLVSKNKIIDILVKILPFLLFPVIFYQLSGYRQGILMYLELYILTTWLLILDKRNVSLTNFIIFLIIVPVVSTWRSENFLYVYIVSFSLLFFRKDIKAQYKVFMILFMFFMFFLLNFIQTKALKNNNYNLVSLDNQACVLVRNADPIKDKEDIDRIGKAFNVDVILEEREAYGTSLYWQGKIIRNGYSKKDYKECLKGIINLSLKYPFLIFNERFNEFINATTNGSEVNQKYFQVYDFFDETGNGAAIDWNNNKYFGGSACFLMLRKLFINIMFFMTKNKTFIIHYLFWNALIPIFMLFLIFVYVIIQRNYKFIWILLPVVFKLPIIILTEPESWFMYYLTFYITGYFVFIYYLFSKGLREKTNGKE